MNHLQNISLLYVSCYTYKSLWEPFFKLKNKYIGNAIQTYLCTDIMLDNNINFEDSIFNNTKILNFNQKSNFTLNGNLFDRYLYYLQQIETEYILYFYDDMFPIEKVDLNKINNLLDIMKNNESIKIIKLSLDSYPFYHGSMVYINDTVFTKAHNTFDHYIFNVQPILIRKDFFIEMVNYCKQNNKCTHQNGGLEIHGTDYFKINKDYISLRVINEVIKIPCDHGVVVSGIISEEMKQYFKEKEDIEIETYENNLIFELTKEEYDCVGDRLKIMYNEYNIAPITK